MRVGQNEKSLVPGTPIRYCYDMTKRHFEAIARIFRTFVTMPRMTDEFNKGYNTALHDIAIALAVGPLAESNERFDTDKFLTACGFSGKVQS